MSEKKNPESYDYSDDSASWRYQGRIPTEESRSELRKISDDLAQKHGFSNLDEHRALVLDLCEIMQTTSQVPMQDGVPRPPADQPTLKASRQAILRARDKARCLEDSLHEFIRNETARELLLAADTEGKLLEMISNVGELDRILSRVAEVKGSKGPPRNPDWIKIFCVRCQKFWSANMSGGTRLVLHLEVESPISEWVHDLYVVLGNFLKIDAKVSMLKTTAKSLPAKRA